MFLAKFSIFLPNCEFSVAHLWVFKIVENRQTHEKISFQPPPSPPVSMSQFFGWKTRLALNKNSSHLSFFFSEDLLLFFFQKKLKKLFHTIIIAKCFWRLFYTPKSSVKNQNLFFFNRGTSVRTWAKKFLIWLVMFCYENFFRRCAEKKKRWCDTQIFGASNFV